MSNLSIKLGALGQDSYTAITLKLAQADSSNWDCFESPSGVNYQVPSGKTFYITKILASALSNGTSISIHQADNGVDNTNVGITNLLKISGDIYFNNSNDTIDIPFFVIVPSLKYPHIYVLGNTAYATIFGVEI